MKQILAFGDSLTWGSDPHSDARHAMADQWPIAMKAGLTPALGDVEVLREGLRGRTTAYERPSAPVDMNGVRALPILLHSHAPLDGVVIMLGTNDIYMGLETQLIRDGLRRLVEIVQLHPWRMAGIAPPKVMLVAPPPLTVCAADTGVTAAKIAQSEALGEVVLGVSQAMGVPYFDAGTVARASEVDGYHLEAAASRALGEALVAPVAAMLG